MVNEKVRFRPAQKKKRTRTQSTSHRITTIYQHTSSSSPPFFETVGEEIAISVFFIPFFVVSLPCISSVQFVRLNQLDTTKGEKKSSSEHTPCRRYSTHYTKVQKYSEHGRFVVAPTSLHLPSTTFSFLAKLTFSSHFFFTILLFHVHDRGSSFYHPCPTVQSEPAQGYRIQPPLTPTTQTASLSNPPPPPPSKPLQPHSNRKQLAGPPPRKSPPPPPPTHPPPPPLTTHIPQSHTNT